MFRRDSLAGGQGPVELRRFEWLGRSNRALILIRKIWERELQAVEAGFKPAPTKIA